MSAIVRVDKNGSNITAVLKERIDAANYEQIQAEVEGLLEEGVETFTFDVNDVTYVSSAGLRMFSSVNKVCKSKGIEYKLSGLREDIMKMFRLTGYASVFKIEVKPE